MNMNSLICMVIGVVILLSIRAEAQGTQFTYCQNGRGEVVIVSNFTCPAGYWPI